MAATFRFYDELSDFLPQARVQRALRARRGRVYWEGSHGRGLRAFVEGLDGPVPAPAEQSDAESARDARTVGKPSAACC